jgi:hypothetical protein
MGVLRRCSKLRGGRSHVDQGSLRDFVLVAVGLYWRVVENCAAVDNKRGGCGSGRVQALAGMITIWWCAFVPHGFRSSFEITWDCSRNILTQMSLLPWSSGNACTRPPRRTRIPHRGTTSRNPISCGPYQAAVLVSHVNLDLHSRPRRLLAQSRLYGYQVSYFRHGHGGSRTSTDGFSSLPHIDNGSSFIHSLDLYFNTSQKLSLLLKPFSLRCDLDTRFDSCLIKESTLEKFSCCEIPQAPLAISSCLRSRGSTGARWRLGGRCP